MGIGIVLIFWAVIGCVLAAVSSIALLLIVRLLSRGAQKGRKLVSIAAITLPFLCLGWFGAVFVFQAIVNAGFLHRDIGIGDSWECPLPNGYSIEMIDLTDSGWLVNRKTQPHATGLLSQSDAADGVRQLQVAGPYLFAAQDTRGTMALYSGDKSVDTYLVIDTRSGTIEKLATETLLRDRARDLGYTLNLLPIYSVYSRYRSSWFDTFAGLLAVIPPIFGVVLLVVWARMVRKRSLHLAPA